MQRVLITGGSRGLGLAIAETFVSAGAAVAITGRTAAHLDAATARLQHGPGTVQSVRGDVRSPEEAAAMVNAAAHALGGLDVLIHAAGIAPPPVDKVADATWDPMLTTHVLGPWYVTRAALPHLARDSRIVVLTAHLPSQGTPAQAAFFASKHAAVGLVRCLALELAPLGITVNAVAPGPIVAAPPAETEPPQSRHTPADVAELVAFLCSPAAAGITAQVYPVGPALSPVTDSL